MNFILAMHFYLFHFRKTRIEATRINELCESLFLHTFCVCVYVRYIRIHTVLGNSSAAVHERPIVVVFARNDLLGDMWRSVTPPIACMSTMNPCLPSFDAENNNIYSNNIGLFESRARFDYDYLELGFMRRFQFEFVHGCMYLYALSSDSTKFNTIISSGFVAFTIHACLYSFYCAIYSESIWCCALFEFSIWWTAPTSS